jgi:hypothetical protein
MYIYINNSSGSIGKYVDKGKNKRNDAIFLNKKLLTKRADIHKITLSPKRK